MFKVAVISENDVLNIEAGGDQGNSCCSVRGEE